MTADEIVDAVLAQGGFPSSQRSLAFGWLNEVHGRAVAESQWLMQSLELGVTVVGRAVYEIPDSVVDIVGLYLDDESGVNQPSNWEKVSTTDMWGLKSGRARRIGSGGVFAPAFGSAGEKRVELYPVPETAGVLIVTLAAVQPDTLVSGGSPVIPADMHGDLLDGAIALGLLRMDERADSAAVFDGRLREMVLKLTRRKNSRVGSRTARMKVHGYDWR
jgi:hypothetical protein